MSSKWLSVTEERCFFFIRFHGGIFLNKYNFRKTLLATHRATVGRLLPAGHILCRHALESLTYLLTYLLYGAVFLKNLTGS